MDRPLDKPFLSYGDLLKKLREEYDLQVPDDDIGIEMLKTISYYNLVNGYKECFMENGKYKKGITLNYLFEFSLFDKNFQNILFKYSVYVENIFKTKLSYTLAKNFGSHESNYLNKNKYIDFIKKESREIKSSKIFNKFLLTISKAKDNPTKHYKKNHNHIPPWILFKNISFNDVTDLYSLLKYSERKEIVYDYTDTLNMEYGQLAELVKTALIIVRKFRNKIAHDLKAITYKTEEEIIVKNAQKILPNIFLKKQDRLQGKGKNDLFSMIISLSILLNNKYLLINMLQELLFLLESNINISKEYIEITNLPEDIENRLKETITYYFDML